LRTHTPDSHLPLWPIPLDFWYPEGSLTPYLPHRDCPAVPSLFSIYLPAIWADRVGEISLEKRMGEVLSAQGKEMSEIKSNLAALSTQMTAMMEEVKKRGKGSPKGEKRVSFQDNKEALNILLRSWLLPRSEALKIPASLPFEDCAEI
jgi:hypothetical protein